MQQSHPDGICHSNAKDERTGKIPQWLSSPGNGGRMAREEIMVAQILLESCTPIKKVKYDCQCNQDN
jgi:hypothetical protein